MKKIKIGLLAIAAIVSVQTMYAQTVDEIVNKYGIFILFNHTYNRYN